MQRIFWLCSKMKNSDFLFFRTSLHVLLFLPVYLFAQDLSNFDQKTRMAVDNRDFLIAIAELEAFEKSDRKSFELNNYDYLLGRTAERTGNLAAAMANYQRVVKRNSILKGYALGRLAQIARSTGNRMLERMYLQESLAFAPDSLLQNASAIRIARSYFESGNYEDAIRLLNVPLPVSNAAKGSIAPQTPNDRIARENLVLLAQAFLQMGRTNESREAYAKLLDTLPNPAQPDDFALAAVKGLDLLDGGKENVGKRAPELTDLEHQRRAFIYQFNRDFADARLHYQAIVESHPESGIVPDAIYQIGRGYAQLANFVEAVRWFERVMESYPDHPVSKDALSQSASAYARVSKFSEAIARYRKLIEKYPDDERLDRAYLNIVDVLRDQGEEAAALNLTANIQEIFRGKLPEAVARFTQARIYLSRNEWQNALNDLEKLEAFSDLGGVSVPGGTSKAEVDFLRGFTLEQMRRYPEAIDAYLSIPDGRAEYYGWRATERLRLMAGEESAKPFVSAKLSELTKDSDAKDSDARRRRLQSALRLTDSAGERAELLGQLKKVYVTLPVYQKLPEFKLLEFGRKEVRKQGQSAVSSHDHAAIADELLFLGLYDEGTPELEAAKVHGANRQPDDLAYTLAIYYKRGDIANRAVGFIEPLYRNVPADYQIEFIPREHMELLYPKPYADPLLRYAPERGVDPRFVLSIVRQESRYRADVKSNAAARGLMQFISTTADGVAGQLARDNFKQEELYYPPTAVLFGSQYISNLFKMFPRQAPAVAASYNGGEDNMKRWMTRSRSDMADRYVPEIIFSQSKDYVYKVMTNYRVYQMLYDENLKEKPQ